MKVVGILLVKNEAFYVERAVRNVLEFCDEFLAVDNGSTDGTAEILQGLAQSTGGKVRFHRVTHPGTSHAMVAGYAGTETWVFGVDGDEIYDPAGLLRLKERMLLGEFQRDWCLFGNVLNARGLDVEAGTATGHLAPPCRSMTKLYNFSAIRAWEGPCLERLHGGTLRFQDGYDETLRRNLHEATPWDETDLRCLHVCFLSRSPADAGAASPRKNIMDIYNGSVTKSVCALWDRLCGRPEIDWKEQRYGRGPLVTVSARPFFPVPGQP